MTHKSFEIGDVVRVGPAYRTGGAFEPDGFEGTYTVVGVIKDFAGVEDYKLARGDVSAIAADCDYDVIVNVSRIATHVLEIKIIFPGEPAYEIRGDGDLFTFHRGGEKHGFGAWSPAAENFRDGMTRLPPRIRELTCHYIARALRESCSEVTIELAHDDYFTVVDEVLI